MITHLIPFNPAGQSISTLTTLLGFTEWAGIFSLRFWLINLDSTNTVDLIVEASPDGVHVDEERIWTRTINPGKAKSIYVGPFADLRFYRATAQTSSPTYPVVSGKFGVTGMPNPFARPTF